MLTMGAPSDTAGAEKFSSNSQPEALRRQPDKHHFSSLIMLAVTGISDREVWPKPR